MKSLVMLISAIGALAACSAAWAQRNAASKIDGAAYEAPYFYDTSDMYQQAAWDSTACLRAPPPAASRCRKRSPKSIPPAFAPTSRPHRSTCPVFAEAQGEHGRGQALRRDQRTP